MKRLNIFITEKLKLTRNNKIQEYNYHPKSNKELRKLVNKLIEERGNDADLNDIDTSEITNMSLLFEHSQFNGDISQWDVSNVKDMQYMFYGCVDLTTIYVGPKWTLRSVTTGSMFELCRKLRGSAGTTYDSNHVNGSYAHIDGGPSNPGYLSERIYNLWVGGTRVTSTNSQSLPSTTGSVTYDITKKTLTLNNATITANANLNKMQEKKVCGFRARTLQAR